MLWQYIVRFYVCVVVNSPVFAFKEYDGVGNEKSRSVAEVRVGLARIDYEECGSAHVKRLRREFFANSQKCRVLSVFFIAYGLVAV